MNNNDIDLYAVCMIASERTEDGDMLVTWEVVAKGFEGIRAFVDQHGHPYEIWTGCGNGILKTTYNVLVDGTALAIEASNDYRASMSHDPYDY